LIIIDELSNINEIIKKIISYLYIKKNINFFIFKIYFNIFWIE
jgi:hypothetical protein